MVQMGAPGSDQGAEFNYFFIFLKVVRCDWSDLEGSLHVGVVSDA